MIIHGGAVTDRTKRILTAAGWIGGWLAVSAWLAMMFSWSVLLLSAGGALLAVAGLRPLGLLLWHGVYFLSKRGPDNAE